MDAATLPPHAASRPHTDHDNLDTAKLVEAVHLVEQLHERPLDLPVRAGTLRKPPPANRINLVLSTNWEGGWVGWQGGIASTIFPCTSNPPPLYENGSRQL